MTQISVPPTSPTFQVRAVTTPADQDRFLDVPYRVYRDDPNWVAPLRSSEAKLFLPDNPFLQYGTLQPLIAVQTAADGSEVAVGRVVAAVNRRLTEREGEGVGIFGFFECIKDEAIASALLDAACDWLRQQGMTRVRGPIDLSTHNRCLFLVEGFDSPPTLMMPYNPSYYPQFIEQNGWHKEQEAYAYLYLDSTGLPPEYEKGYRIACKSGVQFRQLATKGDAFWDDVTQMYHLFTRAFANNFSSTPRTLEEFLEEAKELRSLVDPDIFWIAEYNQEMIGFFMALPDYNIALKHVNGKLDLWGILKFFWFRRQINQVRVIAICSLPEHRRRMVPLALIYLGMTGGTGGRKPYQRAELGYVYEGNLPSRKVTEGSGAQAYKTYRIYQKQL